MERASAERPATPLLDANVELRPLGARTLRELRPMVRWMIVFGATNVTLLLAGAWKLYDDTRLSLESGFVLDTGWLFWGAHWALLVISWVVSLALAFAVAARTRAAIRMPNYRTLAHALREHERLLFCVALAACVLTSLSIVGDALYYTP